MHWFLKAITRNYLNIKGRASRKEFWLYTLFAWLSIILSYIVTVFAVAYTPNMNAQFWILSAFSIYVTALILPSVTVGIRRLHDTGRSAWWWLTAFIPVVGLVIPLILFSLAGDAAANKYGPGPDSGN